MARNSLAFLYKKIRKPCTICAAMIWQEKYGGKLFCKRCEHQIDRLADKRKLSTYEEMKALVKELKAEHKDKWEAFYKRVREEKLGLGFY